MGSSNFLAVIFFCRFVGLYLFVAISAFLNPAAFNLGTLGNIKLGSLIEMSIGEKISVLSLVSVLLSILVDITPKDP